MPVFSLSEDLLFPPAYLANPEGILAIGGDLSPERLRLAYQSGIFPWFSEGDPIIWWSPDPRFILYPQNLKVSKSMRPIFRKGIFHVTYDQDFMGVINNCQKISRPGQEGSWITEEMKQAYFQLHREGFAHSVEVWFEGELVGGLYGVSMGTAFFGESMFAHKSNASKVGFITLVRDLTEKGFSMIDCQIHTQHLESLGAFNVDRNRFLEELDQSLRSDSLVGNWGTLFEREQK